MRWLLQSSGARLGWILVVVVPRFSSIFFSFIGHSIFFLRRIQVPSSSFSIYWALNQLPMILTSTSLGQESQPQVVRIVDCHLSIYPRFQFLKSSSFNLLRWRCLIGNGRAFVMDHGWISLQILTKGMGQHVLIVGNQFTNHPHQRRELLRKIWLKKTLQCTHVKYLSTIYQTTWVKKSFPVCSKSLVRSEVPGSL